MCLLLDYLKQRVQVLTYTGSHRRTINRHQDRRSSSTDCLSTAHSHSPHSREASSGRTIWNYQDAVGEGRHRGEVAGERVG
jgi:hypothetical protein